MNQHRLSERARRLLTALGALGLGAITAGCEPVFAQIVVAAAPTAAAPGANGRVIVREPWHASEAAPTAQIVVSGGSVIAPLEGVVFTCTPKETCSSHADLVQILEPTPGLQRYDIEVAKAGFEPEHVTIEVAHARDLPFRRIFVMLKPKADGAAR